jgi:hypothetical protein
MKKKGKERLVIKTNHSRRNKIVFSLETQMG